MRWIFSAFFLLAYAENKYDEKLNEWTKKLEEAKIYGEEEDKREGMEDEYYKSVWEEQLAPFAKGISEADLETLEKLGNKYQIVNHTVYRKKRCIFQARCEGVDWMLKRVAPFLDDTQFYINDFDAPKVYKRGNPPLPLFSFSKNDDYFDIMYPAWSFHKGGPAISTYPMGIGKWEETRDAIESYADSIPWAKREAKAFFLGSRTNTQRDELVMLSREDPSIADAQFTKNQAYKGPRDTLDAEPAKERPFEDCCQYKYPFNFRGIAASFRFKHLLACGSAVMHVDDGWKEFFYAKLIPFYHYVPVEDNTKRGIRKIVEFARENDEEMRKIGDRGRAWLDARLRFVDIDNYWRGLLTQYTSLLKITVQRDEDLMLVK